MLKGILQRKITEADLNRTRSTTPITLEGGLILRIRKTTGGYTVYLSREGKKPPSESEIKTIMNHWPLAARTRSNQRAGVVFDVGESEYLEEMERW